jgi:hypothetical protein
MGPFDLIEFQQHARELEKQAKAKELFELWEDVCKRYERAEIGPYELKEMKDLIFPLIKSATQLQTTINNLKIGKK